MSDNGAALDRLVAYHEAGHAVIAVVTRLPFASVSIEPDEDSAGHVQHMDMSYYYGLARPYAQAQLRNLLCSLLAGTIAASRAEGDTALDWPEEGSRDRGAAVDVALALGGDGEQAAALMERGLTRASCLLATHWPAVEALAGALLEHKTLTARQARAIVKWATERAAKRAKLAYLVDRLNAAMTARIERPANAKA